MNAQILQETLNLLKGSLVFTDDQVQITDRKLLKENIHSLAEVSALGENPEKGAAQYIIRRAALAFGAIPSSINDLYLSRGRGEIPFTFTVPAMNLRMLTFDSARAVFRVANEMDASAFIFEIARSEMGYTDQRPAEYSSACACCCNLRGMLTRIHSRRPFQSQLNDIQLHLRQNYKWLRP
jgi:hypothetical protein